MRIECRRQQPAYRRRVAPATGKRMVTVLTPSGLPARPCQQRLRRRRQRRRIVSRPSAEGSVGDERDAVRDGERGGNAGAWAVDYLLRKKRNAQFGHKERSSVIAWVKAFSCGVKAPNSISATFIFSSESIGGLSQAS